MKTHTFRSTATLLIAAMLMLACGNSKETAKENPQKAKYVFLFIGDGMGLAQAKAAEIYLASDGSDSSQLSFTQFPETGLVSTHSASSMITCSSAAGTALATGTKTKNGMLGMDSDTLPLKSIAYKIKEAGYKVGIISDVTINHATPASFYAHNENRNNYYEIGCELPESGFDFFGGGGFGESSGKDGSEPSIYEKCQAAGYSIAYGLEQFQSVKDSCKRLLLLQEKAKRDRELPYATERDDNDMKLADVVDAAVSYLENSKGFFIMAEGGKIDWAGHANDIESNIAEVLNLSEAVAVAEKFYSRHPEETLIIVTADHETGGLSLGRDGRYDLDFGKIASHPDYGKTDPEKAKAELSKQAGVNWGTLSHTGTPVPVYSKGTCSGLFRGKLDNTEIPENICKAMGVKF